MPRFSRGLSGRVRLIAVVAVATVLVASPAAAHYGDSWTHLWNQHIRPLLHEPGTINTAENPVHWTKLKGVPAGVADGVDSNGPFAGYGLTRLSRLGVFADSVNSSLIQRRITGTCDAGLGIVSVARDGGVTCGSRGSLVVSDTEHINDVCDQPCRYITTGLTGHGAFLIRGEVFAEGGDLDVGEGDPFVLCELRLATSSSESVADRVGVSVDAPSEFALEGEATATVQAVAARLIGGPSEARLYCSDFGTDTQMSATLTVVRLGTVTNVDW